MKNEPIDPLARRDWLRLQELREKRTSIVREFKRMADGHEVADWNPHVYAPHEEASRRCRRMAPIAHVVGGLIAAGYAYASGSNQALATISAIAIYILVAYLLDVGIETAFQEFAFANLFRKLYLPPFVVCAISTTILIAERFATSADLASMLVHLEPYAWVGLETSSLVLGALAVVGAHRFGWSGQLVAEDERCTADIARIEQNLQIRDLPLEPPSEETGHLEEDPSAEHGGPRSERISSNGPGKKPQIKTVNGSSLTLPLAAALLVAVPAARGQNPAVLMDYTGSVADQQGVANRVAAALSIQLARGGSVRMAKLSSNVFSAPLIEVGVPAPRRSLFVKTSDALVEDSRREAERVVKEKLGRPIPAAGCTSLPDMLKRAESLGDALLITDGVHTCGGLRRGGGAQPQSILLVVLVRSKGDAEGRQEETFASRAAEMRRYLPHAKLVSPGQEARQMIDAGSRQLIFREFDLEDAISLLFPRSAAP